MKLIYILKTKIRSSVAQIQMIIFLYSVYQETKEELLSYGQKTLSSKVTRLDEGNERVLGILIETVQALYHLCLHANKLPKCQFNNRV